MVSRAGTLLIPSGPSHSPGLRHLHIVCTDPCPAGNQLIVSVTTWTNNLCDGSCILDEKDHEWLKHKSWVIYRKTRIETAATLVNGEQAGVFVRMEPVTEDVLIRVIEGALNSPQAPLKIKKYLKAQLGI